MDRTPEPHNAALGQPETLTARPTYPAYGYIIYNKDTGQIHRQVPEGHPLDIAEGEVCERSPWITGDITYMRVGPSGIEKQERVDCLPVEAEGDYRACDILQFSGVGQPDAWFTNKTAMPQRMLAARGILMGSTFLLDSDPQKLLRAMGCYQPRVVIIRGLIFNDATTAMLAEAFPKTQIVNICHSSQAYLIQTKNGHYTQSVDVRLSHEHGNVWYATANDLRGIIDCERYVYMPNVMPDPPGFRPRQPESPLRLSLVAALRAMKNWPNQIIAAAIVHRETPVELVGSFTRAETPDMQGQLEALGEMMKVPFRWVPWKDEDDFWRFCDTEVDIALQCSFSESFNDIGIDHMQFGVPCVGSPAIAYLPPARQVNPDDPREIASAILSVRQDYEGASREAYGTAQQVAASINADFLGAIQRILRRSQHDD